MDRLQSIRILIVEDNPADIRLVQEMLLEAGSNQQVNYELLKASSLEQANRLMAEQPCDLVLLDFSSPDS